MPRIACATTVAVVLSTVVTLGVLSSPPTAAAASGVTCSAPTGPPTTGEPTGGFVGIAPRRLADTRHSAPVPAPVPAGCWLRVDLPADVPADASSVVVTVTNDRAGLPGYLTVHACGSSLPATSNVNVIPAGPTANLAVVAVDSTRAICLFSSHGTDVIVDLVGWFVAGGLPFHDEAPRRVLDTRHASLRPAGTPSPVPAQRVIELTRSVLGVPSAATAVAANLTVAGGNGIGYLTAYPCGVARPGTSNVNFGAGVDRAATSLLALGSSGSLCLELGDATADVIVDVTGWFGSTDGVDESRFGPNTGRIADSRNSIGGWSTPFTPGSTRALDPVGAGLLPAGTRTAVLGVTATRSQRPGFLSARPCGSTAEVSSVNYTPGSDITNLVIVPLADDGTVCISSSESTDVVVDVFGGFGAPGPFREFELGPLPLQPSFDPAVHDYAMRCPKTSDNALDLHVVAMPDTTVTVDGTTAQRLDLALVRDADEAVVVNVDNPSGPDAEYWFRCLPPDFPVISPSGPGSADPGWYVMSNTFDPVDGRFAMILDQRGTPVWYRRTDGGRFAIDVKRLDDGTLAWYQATGTPWGYEPDRGYDQFSLDGTAIREWTTGPDAQYPTDDHDLVQLSNGNVLLASYPVVEIDDPVDCWTPGPTGAYTQTSTTKVADAAIQEVTAAGDVVWSWQAEYPTQSGQITVDDVTVPICFMVGGKLVFDPIHLNSLDVAADGTVVFSARHTDAVFGLDRNTEEISWKLGGTDTDTTDSLTIEGDSLDGPRRQHDARVLPNGDIGMFDNRAELPPFAAPAGGPARYVSYDIDFDAMTASLVEDVRRTDGNSSGAMGSARITPDGGLLVGWGSAVGADATEYDASRKQVFELTFGGLNASYRVLKEPAAAFDIELLRATAGR